MLGCTRIEGLAWQCATVSTCHWIISELRSSLVFPCPFSLFFFRRGDLFPARVRRLRTCLSKCILDETWEGRPAYCSHLRSSGYAHYDMIEISYSTPWYVANVRKTIEAIYANHMI